MPRQTSCLRLPLGSMTDVHLVLTLNHYECTVEKEDVDVVEDCSGRLCADSVAASSLHQCRMDWP